MNLPNATVALVERAKVADYLLSPDHPDALRQRGATHPVAKAVQSLYGMRYSIDGELETPDGRTPRIRSVWNVEAQGLETATDAVPRLITAYPKGYGASSEAFTS